MGKSTKLPNLQKLKHKVNKIASTAGRGTEPCDASTSQLTTTSLSLPQLNRSAGAINSVELFLANDATLKAEILWTIKIVMAHNSCDGNDHLFTNSQNAKEYTCGKTKCGYLVNFVLAPYFHHKVVLAVSKPGCLYTVL